MSQDQDSSQNKTCNAAAVQVVSTGDFQAALKAIDVEEVRRCLEIDRFLVDKLIVVDQYRRFPPLVYAVENFFDSGRSVLELIELVRLLLDHKAAINARDLRSYPRPGWTALHSAVLYNLVEVVELLLKYQAQVDARNDCDCTPLFYAKTVEMARLLIAHGADVNSKDNGGETPLFSPENVEVARLLIANGADVNSRNEYGYPAWLCAMQKHWDLETLRVLVEHGADLQGENGIRALNLAAQEGTLEFMEFLLDQGVPVNAIRADTGETPLHCAVRQRWVPGVQLLLQRGADVNATDRHGKTPFAYFDSFDETHGAAMEVAELLVEQVVEEGKRVLTLNDVHPQPCRFMVEQFVKHPKVDLNARVSADGDTLAFDMIDKLCQNVDVYRPIFMLLIGYGADVKPKHQGSGRTLLHFAAAGSNLILSHCNKEEFHSEVQLLLEKGSDVNAIDNNGFTPLLCALYYGHWKIVRILVDHGADVNIAHKDHGTPLLMACRKSEESTVQLLLDAGAQVDGRSKDGATALLFCVRKRLVGCATLLLNRGADIHAANRKGCTPFLVACKQSGLDMIYCLIRSSSHHRRLGLLSEVSYPSVAGSTTVSAEFDDACDSLGNLFADDADPDS